MKINTAYPYPVLSEQNDDYIDSSFQAIVNVDKTFGELTIDVSFALQNATIDSLLEQNVCVYAIHVECSQTSFRKSYETTEESIKISIPTKDLRGKIDVSTFIIANQQIPDYTNQSLNDWFRSIPITFEKGNLIAIGDVIEATLFEDNTELLNLPSIINIVRSNTSEYMGVETNQDLITISLPTYEYNQYAAHAKSLFKHTILSMIITPALVSVFSDMSEGVEDYEEYTWYQVMDKILAENKLEIEDVGTDALPALKAAQMILHKPLLESFKEIEQFNEMED